MDIRTYKTGPEPVTVDNATVFMAKGDHLSIAYTNQHGRIAVMTVRVDQARQLLINGEAR